MSQTPPARSYRILGLTGGIASGKSTVARILETEFGVPVIDADQVARDLNSPGGKAYPAIVQRFGTGDRGELRRIVFKDPQARRDLEAILHPLIQLESMTRLQEAAKRSSFQPPLVAYEASPLVETGRYRDFDGLLVVELAPELRKQRLIQRDGLAPELADAIFNSQTSDDERRKAATDLIDNSGDLDQLRKQIRHVLQRFGP